MGSSEGKKTNTVAHLFRSHHCGNHFEVVHKKTDANLSLGAVQHARKVLMRSLTTPRFSYEIIVVSHDHTVQSPRAIEKDAVLELTGLSSLAARTSMPRNLNPSTIASWTWTSV